MPVGASSGPSSRSSSSVAPLASASTCARLRSTPGRLVKKKPDGQLAQPLFLCAIDDTLWLSEQEAVDHALNKHFGMFYQAEKTPTDPPKGTYTFVAQCGMSDALGVVHHRHGIAVKVAVRR